MMDVRHLSSSRSRTALPVPSTPWGHTPRTLLFIALALAATPACSGDPGGEVDPYPAPSFALQDVNPASSTYLETVSTEDASDCVRVLYFASFT